VGHAVALAVDAALVVSQWQRRASIVSLHLFINQGHEAGQAASYVLRLWYDPTGNRTQICLSWVRGKMPFWVSK